MVDSTKNCGSTQNQYGSQFVTLLINSNGPYSMKDHNCFWKRFLVLIVHRNYICFFILTGST